MKTDIDWFHRSRHFLLNKKNLYEKMSLKNAKALRKCLRKSPASNA